MSQTFIRTVTHSQGTPRPLTEIEIEAVTGADTQLEVGPTGPTRPPADTTCWNNFGTHKDIDD